MERGTDNYAEGFEKSGVPRPAARAPYDLDGSPRQIVMASKTKQSVISTNRVRRNPDGISYYRSR